MINREASKMLQVWYITVDLVMQTYKNWRNDRTLRLGAGLAYYGMFAIVPIISLMVGVAAYFFSLQDIEIFIAETVSSIFGTEFTTTLQSLSESSSDQQLGDGYLSGLGLIGIGSLIVSASFIFVALQDALDVIWHNSIRLGFRKWIRRYLLAYVIVLLASLLLFTALVLNSAASLAEYIVPGEFVILESIADLLVSLGSWSVGILLLTLIFKLLIYKKVSWVVVMLGSAVTSVLIVVGTWALSLYITNFASSSLSGAIGAVLLVLIWIYYEAQIILIGAQFTRVLYLNIDRIKIPFLKKLMKI